MTITDPESSGVVYDWKTQTGYAHKGKVKKLLADGWEIVSVNPVVVGGMTWGQQIFTLRRPHQQ